MEITRANYLKIMLFAIATFLFINALFDGQQYISANISSILGSTVELFVRVFKCIIYYLFYRYFRNYPDKLQATLSKLVLIGRVYLTISIFLHWTGISAFLTIEGVVGFLVLAAELIWFISLFLKENNEDHSLKAIRLFATIYLTSVFFSFAITFNILYSNDVSGNIVTGKTLIYWIPQFILALPYLILFKFIMTLRPEREAEKTNT